MSYILLFLVIRLVVHLLVPEPTLRKSFFTLSNTKRTPVPHKSYKKKKKAAQVPEKTTSEAPNALSSTILVVVLYLLLLVLIPFSTLYSWITRYRDCRAARNSETAPEKLQELSSLNDRSIHHALVKNPNTPPEALLTSAQYFPFQVTEHPMFGLMLLENPRLIEEMDWNVLVSLFKQKEIPDVFFLGAVTHQSSFVLEAIVQHQKTTLPLLKRIAAGNVDFCVCEMMVIHSLVTPFCLQQWAVHGNYSMQEAIAVAYLNQSLPYDERTLSLLIEHGSDDVQRIISQYCNLSDTLFNKVLRKLSPASVRSLAGSPYTDEAILQKLAKAYSNASSDTMQMHLKLRIARNRSTPMDIINQWVVDPNYKVRAAVAQRQNLSLNHCLKLALDEHGQVRKKLSRNCSITSVMLKQLSTHPHSQVRYFVDSHPNTSVELRTLLLQQIDDDRLSQHV
jgi:hypothetical protein